LKRYKKPRDKKSAEQLIHRNYFRQAVHHYQQEDAATRAFWKEKATDIIGKTGYNLYLGAVIKLLQQGIDLPLDFRE
jgi:uncharacterized membrane protein YbaN (DUF454 family)